MPDQMCGANKSPCTSLVQENLQADCEAPEMFFGRQNFTQTSIGMTEVSFLFLFLQAQNVLVLVSQKTLINWELDEVFFLSDRNSISFM